MTWRVERRGNNIVDKGISPATPRYRYRRRYVKYHDNHRSEAARLPILAVEIGWRSATTQQRRALKQQKATAAQGQRKGPQGWRTAPGTTEITSPLVPSTEQRSHGAVVARLAKAGETVMRQRAHGSNNPVQQIEGTMLRMFASPTLLILVPGNSSLSSPVRKREPLVWGRADT